MSTSDESPETRRHSPLDEYAYRSSTETRATEFSKLRPAANDLERARKVWVRLTQGRAGMLRKTGWRFYANTSSSSGSMPGVPIRLPRPDRARGATRRRGVAGMPTRHRRHHRVRAAPERAAVRRPRHISPPPASRPTTGTKCTGEHQHRELADALHRSRATGVLSGYDSPLYRDLFHQWHRHEIRTGTGQAHTWAARTETPVVKPPSADRPAAIHLATEQETPPWR